MNTLQSPGELVLWSISRSHAMDKSAVFDHFGKQINPDYISDVVPVWSADAPKRIEEALREQGQQLLPIPRFDQRLITYLIILAISALLFLAGLATSDWNKSHSTVILAQARATPDFLLSPPDSETLGF